MEKLKKEAKKASKLIEKHEFIRILTHYDVDGISSAAIMAFALLRSGKRFRISFLKGLNQEFDYSNDELVIFQDMGSGYPDVISKVESDVIIIDHHAPVGKISARRNLIHVNPHLFGLDGSYELSASGVSYIVANEIGNNKDLIGLSVLGMIGDKQKLAGGNLEIIKEGVTFGYIEKINGINLHSGKIKDVLKISTEPYLDFYDKDEELDKFLKSININGEKNIDELNRDELNRLANGLVLRLLKLGVYEGIIDEFIGQKIILKKELLNNAVMLADIVNACGRLSAYSIGFAICMRDKRYLEKGLSIWKKFQTEILEEINKRRNEVKNGKCIRYIIMNDAPVTGPIATVLSRYLYSDRPLVVVNIKKNLAKVSSRTTMKIAQKVNIGEIMRIAAEKVGGRGGGHKVAAGANINPEKVNEFLEEVDKLCCKALEG